MFNYNYSCSLNGHLQYSRCRLCRPSLPQCGVDTVDCRILLDCLELDYSIKGLVIQWIESYLMGHSQFVQYKGVTSKTVPFTSDKPHRSVLGQILFISYLAEVIDIVMHQSFKVPVFADDLQIWIEGSEQCCWSDDSYVDLYRVCCIVDELKSTPAQSIKNRVDMAGYESLISALWCWRQASRLCSRSRFPNRQQPSRNWLGYIVPPLVRAYSQLGSRNSEL